MIQKLQSAISTIHATVLAVREVPEALRYVVEFARENGTHEEIRKLKKDAVVQALANDELVTILVDELDVERFVNNEQWNWAKERIESLQSTINETRELLSSLSSYLGYGLGGENESLASMTERVETGIKHHLGVTSTMIGDLQSKLARYEAAEKWHQVTSGEGELPPPIPVLWRNNHPDFPLGELNFSIQGACGTYEWRFLSNEDVPNV